MSLSLSQCKSDTQIRLQSHCTYAAVRYTITDFRWTLLLCKYVFRFSSALSIFSVVHENISGRYLPKTLWYCCHAALTAVISLNCISLKEICNFRHMWSLYGTRPCEERRRATPNSGVVVLGDKHMSSAKCCVERQITRIQIQGFITLCVCVCGFRGMFCCRFSKTWSIALLQLLWRKISFFVIPWGNFMAWY